MDTSNTVRFKFFLLKWITYLAIGVFITTSLTAQVLSMDPRDCGYACSAKDVVLSEPYLAKDLDGTPLVSCNGDSGEVLNAYIAFSLQNTTGSDRYTPMISATLNINGVRTNISGCFPDMPPQETAIRVLPLELAFICESEIFLEEVWIGWNVVSKTCEQLQGETRCNRLIPSGKCGDYNSIPQYIKIPVETPIVLGEENTVSRCGDGIDNDGNGLTDCDDFDCVRQLNCEYTETSSGIDGGLESNNRLLERIAERQYKRSQQGKSASIINRRDNQFIKQFNKVFEASKTMGLPKMEEIIPMDVLPESLPYLSTPEDLPQLTNATRSLSVDFYRDNQPIAAILGTRTQGSVYEHTKVVCDRVGETRVEKIWAIALDGVNPMLINKLKHKNGTVEYSCSFSAHLDQNESLIIESHWNVYEYPEADNYLNFQVWAANTQTLRLLVNGLIKELKNATGLTASFATGEVPSVYIHQTSYRNHILQIEVANPGGEKSVSVTGVMQRVESGPEENFEWDIALSGSNTEILEIDTDAVYSLGLTLWGNPKGPADTIFFADGIWAMDIDPNKENAQFMVFQDYQSKYDEDWYVERGVQISGQMNEKYAWYRALNNTFKEVDLEAFQTLTFETQSEYAMEMEVVLAQSGQNWENQLRKKIIVNPGQQTHTLVLEAFDGNREFLKAINMVVFLLENKGQSPQEVRLELQKMRFSRQLMELEDQISFNENEGQSVQIFPNPLAPHSEIGFYSSQTGKASWKLSNSGGQVIRNGELSVIKGSNQKAFYQDKLSSGIYFLELQLPDAEHLHTAVLVR